MRGMRVVGLVGSSAVPAAAIVSGAARPLMSQYSEWYGSVATSIGPGPEACSSTARWMSMSISLSRNRYSRSKQVAAWS